MFDYMNINITNSKEVKKKRRFPKKNFIGKIFINMRRFCRQVCYVQKFEEFGIANTLRKSFNYLYSFLFLTYKIVVVDSLSDSLQAVGFKLFNFSIS